MSDLWEDDGTACTPCRDCPGCHAVKPARAPGAGVESPDASEAVRSPHSKPQTLPSPSVRARTSKETQHEHHNHSFNPLP